MQEVVEAATAKKQEYAMPDGQAAGLALRVRPSGVKSWVLRRRYGGKAKPVTLGTFKNMTSGQVRAIAIGDEAFPAPRKKRKADIAKRRQSLNWRRSNWRIGKVLTCPSSEFFGELRLFRNGGSGSVSV